MSDIGASKENIGFRPIQDVLLIAGPTASGKSALALKEAQQGNCVIINADSMQVYDVLNVLSARPTPQECATVPHFLFGHVNPAVHYSTGAWLSDVEDVLVNKLNDRRAIFVGGTGLYFKALLGGLSPIPDVPQDVRNKWREELIRVGCQELHNRLKSIDEVLFARLSPNDGQRIVRALEVYEASGKPLSYWQSIKSPPLVDEKSARCLVLKPDRSWLLERIERRFDIMLKQGAMDEVRCLLAQDIPSNMPSMRAIGVHELSSYFAKQMTLEQARQAAIIATRQYAKRQATWFRNQLGEGWEEIGLGEK